MDREPTVRICHVFVSFDCGGSQMRLVRMLDSLDSKWHHDVVALDGRAGASASVPTGVHCRVLPWRVRRGTPATVRGLVGLLRDRRPSLVATYNFGAIDGVVAARLTRIPVVHHEEVVYADERRFVAMRRNLLRRFVLRGAAAVVVPSHRLEQRARRAWGLPAGRLHRVPNGVVVPSACLRAHRDGPLVVGCVAGFRREKNHERLLRAFACLRASRDAELWLVGDGRHRRECELLAHELGVGSSVRFLGHRVDPSPLYRAMDVFVLPSDDEQMPLALLEAMAHSLPVVATAVGDVPRMVPVRQAAFLVEVGARTIESLAATLGQLLASPSLREELGAANREHVIAHHSLAAMVSSYREILQTAMAPGAA